MAESLEFLSENGYFGRFIVLGLNADGERVAVYGITGRSASSQARRLEYEPYGLGRIMVQPTDIETLKKGNPDLLIYPAMVEMREGLGVSNGKQTQSLMENSIYLDPLMQLMEAHREWTFEPDSPNFTPRISGIIYRAPPEFERNVLGILGIIKHVGDGKRNEKQYFEVQGVPGVGSFISTYNGLDANPLQGFDSAPRKILIPGNTPKETAQAFYDSLLRKDGKDYRVSVTAAYVQKYSSLPSSGQHFAIINRHSP